MIIDKNGNKHVEIGDKYGKLTVIEKSNNDYITSFGYHIPKYICKCECGNYTEILEYSLTNNRTKSCGHCSNIHIGDKFGKLTVLEKDKNDCILPSGRHIPKYICKCECGNIISVLKYTLLRNQKLSCGNCNSIHIGDKFGKLTVISKASDYINPNSGNCIKRWLCKCECGNTTIVRDNDLKRGITKSCGCLIIEQLKKRNSTHLLSNTLLYREYSSMIQRCYNPNNIRYPEYGQRGIQVCREWYNSDYKKGFDPECINIFYNWAINNGYKEGLTIDRINVNGNYEPSNCRWIPKEYQAHNRRNSIKINLNGEIYDIGQISSILGIDYMFLYHRLKKNNWDLSSLFTYITDQYGNTRPYILDKYNNPIPINIIYFIDEYGFPISQDKINESNI